MKHRFKVPCIPRQEATVSVLQKEILLVGSEGRRRCNALFDSGSSVSIIRRDLAESLQPLSPLVDLENWVFETAQEGQLVQVRFSVALTFHFDDSKENFHDEFFVFDECSEEVIIGARTMQMWKIVLDFQNDDIRYPKTAMRLRI
jgi:hypothetical protein